MYYEDRLLAQNSVGKPRGMNTPTTITASAVMLVLCGAGKFSGADGASKFRSAEPVCPAAAKCGLLRASRL
jgi:hypothetical protein